MSFGRELPLRIGQQPINIAALENPAASRPRIIKDVPHKIEKRSADIFECWDREVALRPVDDSGWQYLACRLFQDVLAAIAYLQLSRDPSRKLDHLMIEEGHARLQAPRHCHVVDP